MGVGASRQLARCLNDACGSLDDNDSLDPETTEHLLQSFKVLWEGVPNDAQARVRSVTAKERRRFGVGAECEEPIKLSRTIEEQLEKWKSQPEVALRPLATRQEFSKDYVVFLHQCLVDLDRTGEVAAIQRRLLLLAMVKLRTALGDDEKAIAQYLSGTEERSVERKDVLRWCTIGARYEAIARDLGGPEALFVLPSNISINVWERVLATSGEKRSSFMAGLINRGIKGEASKCKETVDAIFSHQDREIAKWKINTFRLWNADVPTTPNTDHQKRRKVLAQDTQERRKRKAFGSFQRPAETSSRAEQSRTYTSVDLQPVGLDSTNQPGTYASFQPENIFGPAAASESPLAGQVLLSNHDSPPYPSLTNQPDEHLLSQPSIASEQLQIAECSEFNQHGGGENWVPFTQPWESIDLNGVMDSFRSHAGALEGGNENFFP